jgi:Tfp pilus assembly protein PilF
MERDPSDPKAPTELGEIYLRLKQDRIGAYWLQVALKRDPTFQPAHRLLAGYYASVNEERKAAFHRRKANLPNSQ